MKPDFSRKIFEINTQTPNYTKSRPVETELFHANGQTGRHDKAAAFRNFANTPTNAHKLSQILNSTFQ